jgi:hypothetical protein
MREKILVWLDVSLIHFGISKHLKQNDDYEIYGIVDTNKGRIFYENQKIVQFSKIWFYRDCFSKFEKEIDIKYLKEFEKKYKIDLWKIAYADEMIYGYNKFHKFKEVEILRIIEKECKFFEKVLDEVKPKFLLTRITDTSSMELLTQLCIAKGIIPLISVPTRLGNKFIISESFDMLDSSFEDNKKILENEINTFQELKTHIEIFSKRDLEYLHKYKTAKMKWVLAALNFLRLSVTKNYKGFFRNKGRTGLNVTKYSISFAFKKLYRKAIINKKLLRKFNDGNKFVYFPLQLEPERTVQIPAPYYTNQLEVIRQIAKSLPVDYLLYVKEHPAQKLSAWRSVSFYYEILKMPNVEMYHPSVSNNIMIGNCSLVITVTGSSGLEAIINEKPCIVLANTTYSKISAAVHQLENIQELPVIIGKMLKIKPKLEEVKKYFRIIESKIFEYDEIGLSMNMNNYFYYDGFLFDNEISLSKMELFLKENQEELEKLSVQYEKKFKLY